MELIASRAQVLSALTANSRSGKLTAFAERVLFVASTLILSLAYTVIPSTVVGHSESEWSVVLGLAAKHKLGFGRDIVFTYGPFGFLTSPYWLPGAPGTVNFEAALLGLWIGLGVCLLSWRVPGPVRIVVILVTVMLGATVRPEPDLVLFTGLFTWLCLCFVTESRGSILYLVSFTALSIFAGLAKSTFLFLGAALVVLIALDLGFRRRRLAGVGIILAYLAALPAVWVILGQDLDMLPRFVERGLSMSYNYNLAMGLPTSTSLTVHGLLAYGLSVGAVFIALKLRFGRLLNSPRMATWFVALSLLLFVAWKQGFVRADDFHTEVFLALASIVALHSLALTHPTAGVSRYSIFLAFVCSVITFSGLKFPSLLQTADTLTQNSAAVFNPIRFRARQSEWSKREAKAKSLPSITAQVSTNSIDVFGRLQLFAVCNDFNYRPRPVFHSYAAFSRDLALLNEEYYKSERAPDYVLFELLGIDGRFPSLEDPLTLKYLLLNYRLSAEPRQLLLLRRAGSQLPKLELIEENTVALGESIDLSSHTGDTLWLEAVVEPTPAGSFRSLLLRSAPLTIEVATGKSSTSNLVFNAPAPMLRAGFLASPVLLRTADVRDLYLGRPVPAAAQYRVGSADQKPWWQAKVRYSLFRVSNTSFVPLLPTLAHN
jgi:hypothetical protein